MEGPLNTKKRVGRPKGSSREYFQQIAVFDSTRGIEVLKWKCNYCELQYGQKTGTANFTRHLKTSHNIELDESGEIIRPNPNLINMGYDGSPHSPTSRRENPRTPQIQIPTPKSCMYSPQAQSCGPSSVIQPGQISPTYSDSSIQLQVNPTHLSPTASHSNYINGNQYVYAMQDVPQQSHQQPSVENSQGRQFYNSSSTMHAIPQQQSVEMYAIPQQLSVETNQVTQLNISSTMHAIPQQSSAETNQRTQLNISSAMHAIPQQPFQQTSVENINQGIHVYQPTFKNNYTEPQSAVMMGQLDDFSHTDIEMQDIKLNTSNDDPFKFLSFLSYATDVVDNSSKEENFPLETFVQHELNVSHNGDLFLQDEFQETSLKSNNSVNANQANKFETSPEMNNIVNLHFEMANKPLMTNVPETSISDSSTMQMSTKLQNHNYFLSMDPKSENAVILRSSMKRNQTQLYSELEEFKEFDDIYKILESQCRTRIEIQDTMIEMVVNSPMHLNSFLLSNMHDFFSMTNEKFPKLNLTLIDLGMLGRQHQKIKDIIKDQCDPKWDPFIFDVYVFPMSLDSMKNYIMIELVYLDKKGHRRSCPMECFSILPHYTDEVLNTIILGHLRNFGVENKIADFHVWGKKYPQLQRILKKGLIRRGRQRALAFKDDEEKKAEYFSSLRKNQEDSVYGIQIETSQCLSSMDRMESILIKHKQYLKNREGSQAMESEKSFSLFFLERASQRFQELGRKMTDVKTLSADIKTRLFQITRDTKYAVYYSHKNNPINLLQIIPMQSYEQMLKDLACYVNNFTELLDNANEEGNSKDAFSNMSKIEEELRLIEFEEVVRKREVPSLEPVKIIEMALEASEKWKQILQRGVGITSEYYNLCQHFSAYKTRDTVQSRYVEEFENVCFSAPIEMSPEEWKKAAMLRAWKKFATDSYR